MSSKRTRELILAALLAVAAAWGCSERLDEPEFDNPFDPLGPSGGDPFQIEAVRSGSGIKVSWNRTAHPGISAFVVHHSTDGTSFDAVSEDLPPGTGPRDSFLHETPLPNAINYYKVQAKGSDGQQTSISGVASASDLSAPYLEIADGAVTTPTRLVTLSIRTSVGDLVEIADNTDFAGSSELQALPGDTTQLVEDWDLGPAAENNTRKRVYLRVKTGGETSLVAKDSISVSFSPTFRLAGNPSSIAHPTVDLQVLGFPGTSMRFASSTDALESAAWVPADTVFAGYELNDSLNPQTIYGEFLSDFGFSTTAQKTAVPDDLTSTSFAIESLDGDAELTESRTIRIVSNAVALQMRFAESPSFIGVPWLAYADTFEEFELSETEGLKVVYGQFRNFWADSRVTTDAITLFEQPLDVRFIAPQNGAIVRGGTPMTVTGQAVPASGVGAIDAVQVDLGDGGGFVPANGTQNWLAVWDVPTFDADTDLILRARAIAGTDTATASITVTVSQLLININSPPEGAFVIGGKTSSITGSASGVTGGAPLELVQIDVGQGWVDATGTANWTFSWTVPEVTTDTEVTIAARVLAGGEIATDSIGLTITQPTISIETPLSGATVPGGTTVPVSGIAAPASNGAAIDSVRVDAGDGWIAPGGDPESWSLDWDVPTVIEPTPRTVKARVWSGGGTAVDSVTVTIE